VQKTGIIVPWHDTNVIALCVPAACDHRPVVDWVPGWSEKLRTASAAWKFSCSVVRSNAIKHS